MASKTPPAKKQFGLIRRYFVAGILFLAPLALTVWLLRFLINAADSLLAIHNHTFLFVIPERFHPESILGFHIPGLGVVVAFTLVLLAGLFARNYLGSQLILLGESLLKRIPLVSTIYNALKQLFGTVLNEEQQKNLGKVVLVEFPHKGVWSLAFMTGEAFSKVQKQFKKKMVNLLVPNTPNPTTGFFIMVAEDELLFLDITTEEAFKLLLSFGIINPDDKSESVRAGKTGNLQAH